MLVFLRVHILADVTSLSVTPSSAGLNVLDEHCMPDQDRIPHASIHHNFVICNSFFHQLINLFDFYALSDLGLAYSARPEHLVPRC